MDAALQWYERAAEAGFEPARKELAAINQPAVSAEPAIESGAVAPAESKEAEEQPVQAQKEATPPPAGAEAKTDEKPAEAPPAPAPAETQQATTPPPAEEPKQPEPAAPAAEAEIAPPAENDSASADEEEQAQEGTPETLAGEGSAGINPRDPISSLPVATSLTGDAQVYRIWLYESGQEGDARSYWDKLMMQYPGLLKKLDVDIRRYFLGEAKGSLYRVFAGPFENLGAAQQACEDIRTRFGDQFCRPVLN
jgi:hypothetical protein